MKKIILSESQAKILMDKVVSEQINPSGKYSQNVKSDFDYHQLKYKGGDVDWVDNVEFTVSFDIDMDGRSYGIKDVSIMNVKGPEALDIVITYYPEGSEDSIEEEVQIKLDWDNVKIEKDANIGWIGIDSVVDINLTSGEIIVHAKDI